MPYLTRLSKTQYLWLIGTLIAAAGIVALGWALEPRHEKVLVSSFTTEMSLREIAPQLGVTGKALARELGLPLNVSKTKPLGELGAGQDQLHRVAAHLLSHRPTPTGSSDPSSVNEITMILNLQVPIPAFSQAKEVRACPIT